MSVVTPRERETQAGTPAVATRMYHQQRDELPSSMHPSVSLSPGLRAALRGSEPGAPPTNPLHWVWGRGGTGGRCTDDVPSRSCPGRAWRPNSNGPRRCPGDATPTACVASHAADRRSPAHSCRQAGRSSPAPACPQWHDSLPVPPPAHCRPPTSPSFPPSAQPPPPLYRRIPPSAAATSVSGSGGAHHPLHHRQHPK